MIYLDTHVVVALYQDVSLLTRRARQYLSKKSEIFISPMAYLELVILCELNRIRYAPRTILDHLEESIGATLCSKSFDLVILAAAELGWTRDPFDRIIVAQAKLENDTLLTKDANILRHYRRAVW